MISKCNLNQCAKKISGISFYPTRETTYVPARSSYLQDNGIVKKVINLNTLSIIKNKTIFGVSGSVQTYQYKIASHSSYVGGVTVADYSVIHKGGDTEYRSITPISRQPQQISFSTAPCYPTKMGCVFSDYITKNLQLLGVKNNYIYMLNDNQWIICQIRNTETYTWQKNINIIDTSTIRAYCDDTGLYLYADNILRKYAVDDGNVTWTKQMAIDYFKVTQDSIVIALSANNVYYIDSNSGNILHTYKQSFFSVGRDNISIDWISGYVVMHNISNNNQAYRVIVLNKDGEVLYNLTSGFPFLYDNIQTIAILSNQKLVVVYKAIDTYGNITHTMGALITLSTLTYTLLDYDYTPYQTICSDDIQEVVSPNGNGIYTVLSTGSATGLENKIIVTRMQITNGRAGFNQILENKVTQNLPFMPSCCFDNNKIYYIANDEANSQTNRIMGMCDNYGCATYFIDTVYILDRYD